MEKNEIENKPDDISGVKIDGKRNMASVSLIKRTVLFNVSEINKEACR